MREYEQEILERYALEVKSTRRIRGAFFCDTDEGAMLLKETNISEKRAFSLYRTESWLESLGMLVDTPVFTKEGDILSVSRDGTKYIMKKWKIYQKNLILIKQKETNFSMNKQKWMKIYFYQH